MIGKPHIGIVHGRFQPLHIGHMEYIQCATTRCEHLIVGIANPDPSLTVFNAASPHRSRESANPFRYYERQLFIRHSLLDAGVLADDFTVVPFPINKLELLQYYVPEDATHFITIYDAWGYAKRDALKAFGFQVEVLWENDPSKKLTSGQEIRRRIAQGESWENLVPSAVARIIHTLKLESRVRELLAKEGAG